MSSYLGRHAELYDLFYAEKPYAAEAQFVHQQLQASGVPAGARLLEAACGTGKHAAEFHRLGYQVHAFDYSADMIAQARSRAAAQGISVDFHCADMRHVELPIPQCDAAICLFDSIGYVQTNEALQASLNAIRRHVRPDGFLLVEFWHAGAMLRNYDPLRVRRWQTAAGEVLRLSETSLDLARQLSQVQYTVYEHQRDGQYTTFQETQVNRYFLLREMEMFMQHAGWRPLKALNGFTNNEQIDANTWHIVMLSQNVGQQRCAA